MAHSPASAGERVKLWRTKEERETLENHAGAVATTPPPPPHLAVAQIQHRRGPAAGTLRRSPRCATDLRLRCCADLFAILKTTEKLERAWTQDAISAADYELACTKLIAQFKTLWATLRDTVRMSLPVPEVPGLSQTPHAPSRGSSRGLKVCGVRFPRC